ncbi:MAG: acetyl-CoA hydrolase/transferase C-terminal domain-containing protein [Bacteroidaceae bacterium]
MNFPQITVEEAAALIQNGDTVGIGGFTPAGSPKVITPAIARRAVKEHEEGRPFKINILSGASTGVSVDKVLSEAHAIQFRAPYITSKEFRTHANNNEVSYTDITLSGMATQLRQGFLGELDWAIVEVCAIERVGDNVHLYPTTGVGIAPTICRMAKKGVFVELNTYHNVKMKGIHDIYEIEDHPYRTPIMILKTTDRIGKPYIEVPASQIRGVVTGCVADEARAFSEPSETTNLIGQNVADFLSQNRKQGLIPASFLNIQSGVGSGANAVLSALGHSPEVPNFSLYTEVLQNAPVELIKEGRVTCGSTCALTVTPDVLKTVYDNIDFFKERLVLRPSEISNNPEVIARIGVCSLNTAIEVDIYGHVNSTKIGGTHIMNGIGGSCDFTNNSYLSIFTCGSTAKDNKVSSIVPFCSHIDHTSHFVDAVITEYGVADLRGKYSLEKAAELIKVAHPDYRPLLEDYLKLAAPHKGHAHHYLPAAFAMHDTLCRKGDMRLTDWSEYIKY